MAEKTQNTKLPMSAMAITSLVIGIVALLTSFIPIVNNGSGVLAALGVIFGIVGLVGIFKGKKRSKVFGIIALTLNVLAFIVVLATQNMWGQALDNASGNRADKVNGASEVKVGEVISFDNGLDITVVSAQGGLKNYDGSALTKVTIKFVNNGSKEVSYNSFDWKGENAQGNQTNTTIYSKGTTAENLNSGKLAPGGTVTGVVYFSGDVVKIIYESSVINGAKATWLV